MTRDLSPNPAVLGRLETTNLRARARAMIRSSIIAGTLQPGRIYSVAFFAGQLGVSATPVREALFDLASEGLVEVVRNRGFVVPVLGESDLDEIYEIRTLLEVPSIGRLAGHLDRQTEAACRSHARQNEKAAATGDVDAFLETDRLFHGTLLGALGNGRLADLIGRFRDLARLTGLTELAGSPRLTTTAREHQLLLDAVVEGDAEHAMRLMRRHLEHTRGLWAGRDEG
jgi:DNA-binding GntR family transcriptional regulator